MNEKFTGPDGGGFCLAVFYLLPKRHIKRLIPEPLDIIEVLPGFTVGGIYAARFAKDQDESMSEFGILQAYVRHGEKSGYFMRHYCVDQDESVAPGHHEPSERHGGEFSWDITGKRLGFTLHSGGKQLISVRLRPLLRNLPFSASIPMLCVKGGNVVFMRNQFASSIGLSTSSVSIPKGSPLGSFPFRVKLLSAFWDASNIVSKEHEFIKERVIKRADEAFGSPIGRGTCKDRATDSR